MEETSEIDETGRGLDKWGREGDEKDGDAEQKELCAEKTGREKRRRGETGEIA